MKQKALLFNVMHLLLDYPQFYCKRSKMKMLTLYFIHLVLELQLNRSALKLNGNVSDQLMHAKGTALFAKKLKMYCNNKALVNLLKRPSSKLPLRIKEMLLQLSGYEFEIEYIKSESNILDFLSRHPILDKRPIDKNIYKNMASFLNQQLCENQ